MQFSYQIKKAFLLGKEKPIAYFKIERKECCYLTLENFSKEGFEEGLNELIQLLNSLDGLDESILNLKLLPSVRFFFFNYFKKEPSQIAKSAGLLFSPELEAVLSLVEKGFETIKLKFKKLSISELKLIETVAKRFEHVKWRIDFNQNLDRVNALYDLPLDRIDYIEEPISNFENLPNDLISKVALDETLRNNKRFDTDQNFIYVIKPLLHDSFDKLISTLKLKKKRIIISSSFEAPCGIKTLHSLISHHELNDETHGLDTIRYYDNLPSF